jgi:hypothetical protein
MAKEGTFEIDLNAMDLPVTDAIVCVSGITAEVEWYEDVDEELHWNVTLMVDANGSRVPLDVTDPLGRALFIKVHSHIEQHWQGIIHDNVEERAPRRDQHRKHRLGMRELL